MNKYIFKRYYKCSNGEIDDENVWITADSEAEARAELKSEYWNTVDLYLLKVENENFLF